MLRRQFIGLVGGAVTLPLAAKAQQPERPRRIGFLSPPRAETDTEVQTEIKAFEQALHELGWTNSGNTRIEYRFGDAASLAKLASELIEWQPDVILAVAAPAANALRQHTLSISIVFVRVPDPIAAGFVTNLARPEGNITGFTNFEFAIGGKWLEILTECAPGVSTVVVVFDPDNPTWTAYLRSIEAAAPRFGVRLTPAGVRDVTEIKQRIAAFGREASGALVVLPSAATIQYRQSIIAAAAQQRLPAIYPYRFFTVDGGFISYGIDAPDLYRRAAAYVDRILRGAMIAELPVQQPTKFELVINLKTAKALGLTIPPALLARADEVIE